MKYNLRVLVPSPVGDAEINTQYEDILDVSFANWETKKAPKKLTQQLIPSDAMTVRQLLSRQFCSGVAPRPWAAGSPLSYSSTPPVAAEDLPPWVFCVDHYSADTAVHIPKEDAVLALPSTFRSVIHPGDRGTPLPFWLLDLWRRLRNVHTVRSNVERGLEWLSEVGRQEEVDRAVVKVQTARMLDLPALLHPWCDLFSHLTTDDRDLNDELIDAVVAIVMRHTDRLTRPLHVYSPIVTQLSPVDLVDLFGKLAARGDFATDSIICLPWYIGGEWVFVLINMAGDDIRIGYCIPQHDHDGLLEIAMRTAIRIAHTVEVSVRQTRTDWIVRKYQRGDEDQEASVLSGLAIAVGFLKNLLEGLTVFSSETARRHRIEVLFAILDHHPHNPVILEDEKLSLWESQDTVRIFSRTLVPPLTVLSTSPPVFTRTLEPPSSSSTATSPWALGFQSGKRLSDLYGGTAGIRLGRCASLLPDTGATFDNPFHIAAGVHADTRTSVVFLDRPIKAIYPPRRAEPDGWCLVVLPPVHSYATAGALLQARLSTVGIHSEAHHARDCRTVSSGIQPKACHSVDDILFAAGIHPHTRVAVGILDRPRPTTGFHTRAHRRVQTDVVTAGIHANARTCRRFATGIHPATGPPSNTDLRTTGVHSHTVQCCGTHATGVRT
ncbi:uncharacterized protein BXZ73DRAFT_108528 [Epithele typhae]|uniref:uncharacterized protein n=1 Tax=Epithele typhae TaxID=378194 RepID=UPI002008E860|nr:uncharacterized protein BXZ73DRAFT_108528 [Epithele typhae]KAH9910761.1 hypothetical protein BXZ73DRAFT_108528 [Epithele typhae]